MMTRAIALSLVALATNASARSPTTAPAAPGAPREWFGDGRSAAALFPDASVDPAISDALPRTVWNALNIPGRPPSAMPKLLVLDRLFTPASMAAFDASDPRDATLLVPDERMTRLAAIDAQKQGAAICLDLERYPLSPRYSTDAQVDFSTRQIARVVGWIRDQSPSVRIFNYAAAPDTDIYSPAEAYAIATTRPDGERYGWWMNQKPRVAARLEQWLTINARLRRGPGRSVGYAELFDALCPSLYLGQDGRSATTIGIQALVRAHVAEGRKYGKSVYPFVWPCWYETKVPIDLGNWVTLLRETTRFADGAVLWSDLLAWDFPITFRVRIATELARRHGRMTNRELHDALAADFKGYKELAELLTLTNEAEEQQLP